MTKEELNANIESIKSGLSRWLDRPIAELVDGATKDGIAYDKCSADGTILALAICIVPKDDKFKQRIKEFVARNVGDSVVEPIENLRGLSLDDLLEVGSIQAVTLREFESPYTVLLFTGNPKMAKVLSDRFLSGINSGTVDYYI